MRVGYGYGRTSTVEQEAGLEAQARDLKKAGAEKIFLEKVSSAGKRMQLEAAVDFVREQDVLIVTRLDRLARSMTDLIAITSTLKAKGVELEVLDGFPRLGGRVATFSRSRNRGKL